MIGRSPLLRDSDQHELVESIAVWTENLRDVIGASAGIIDAIVATAHQPPSVIEDPLRRLAASSRYEPLEVCLRAFADDLDHPASDFVVAALVTAARNPARDLTMLLTHLADCTRLECELYMRIWVSRARARTAVRIVVGAVCVFATAMLVFGTGYLAPYATSQGALVATGICTIFVTCVGWMKEISKIELPRRFLAHRPTARHA